jgi:iron complex transport system substrate-binding protein
MSRGFQRIICLTAETCEVLYLLGEQTRIVGISGYTTHPAIARKEKSKVGAFTSAKIDRILALQPDLVLTCTDLQADIAASLIKAGIEVHAFNQRSVAQILQMILTMGALVDAREKAAALVQELERSIAAIRASSELLSVKPKVYFEEWDEPMISGIRWVSELIEIAGGMDCFPELAQFDSASDRVIGNPAAVVERNPDIIIGSWCGKKFQPEQVMQRPGWQDISAVRHGFLHEIKSADILQPGPSVIQHGLQQLHAICRQWAARQAFSKHWD